jgi:hypothetical protein
MLIKLSKDLIIRIKVSNIDTVWIFLKTLQGHTEDINWIDLLKKKILTTVQPLKTSLRWCFLNVFQNS